MKHPTKTKTRKKISIWLDIDALEWLQAHQTATDVPIAAFVRRAVGEAIERAKKK